jgi:hypothetical protein
VTGRRTERRLTRAMIQALGLLAAAALLLPATVSSAPLAQEQPGEDIYLDYGEEETKTLYAYNQSEVFGTYVFRVHVPAGAKLTVWLGEDTQGGCYSEGLLFIDGSQMGYTTVGPAPSSWSDPIVAIVNTGYAQLAFRGYADCDASVSFPVEKYVRFKVESPPSEVITVPTPEIEFWADRDHIGLGECTTLHWHTEHVQAVYYQGEGVPGDSERQECPQWTTTYELRVVVHQAAEQLIEETRQVTVHVEATPTPSLTPTRTPTRTPTPARHATRTPTSTRMPTHTVPPTRTPRPTSTPRPSTPTPTRAPLWLAPSPAPTASPSPRAEPPWVLVVTHSGALYTEVGSGAWSTIESLLNERYGEENIDVLDLYVEHVSRTDWREVDQAIEQRRDTYADLPNFILIIGGPEVVAFGEVENTMWGWCAPKGSPCDYDFVFTDDPYGSFDNDVLPEVPTARLPDGGDLGLYRAQFSSSLAEGRTHHDWGSAMTVAMEARPYGRDFAALIGATVQWSPPVDTSRNKLPAPSTGHNAYFILHGSGYNTGEWIGDDPAEESCYDRPTLGGGSTQECSLKYPPAWNVDLARDAGSQGTVISGVCYGAFIGLPRTYNADGTQKSWPVSVSDSIALTYLRNGTEAFMGHTATTYSYVTSYRSKVCWPWPFNNRCSWYETGDVWPVDEGSEAIEWFAFSEIANGQHPLIAFHRAKAAMANSLGPPDVYDRELKALHSFVYYGLPPAPLRIEF